MNLLVLLAAMVAATNPAGRALRLRHLDPARAALGAVASVAVVGALAAVASPVLQAADISAPNLRVAAGLVLTAAGLVDLVRRPPPPVPIGSGWGASLVPVAFPVLLEPQVGVLALAAGADRGVVIAALAAAAALALWAAAGVLPSALLGPLARLSGALGVVAGTALVADGVLSV